MEIKTLEHQERQERAAVARQELSAIQDQVQAEISSDTSLYYSRAWYVPIAFWLIFASVYVATEMSTGKMNSGNWQEISWPLAMYSLVILVLNYLLFGIAKMLWWLRLRPVQLAIVCALYVMGAYMSQDSNGITHIDFNMGWASQAPFVAFLVPAIVAGVWMFCSIAARFLRK